MCLIKAVIFLNIILMLGFLLSVVLSSIIPWPWPPRLLQLCVFYKWLEDCAECQPTQMELDPCCFSSPLETPPPSHLHHVPHLTLFADFIFTTGCQPACERGDAECWVTFHPRVSRPPPWGFHLHEIASAAPRSPLLIRHTERWAVCNPSDGGGVPRDRRENGFILFRVVNCVLVREADGR